MKTKNFSKRKILRKLKYIKDPRGDLSVGNFKDNIPFRPKRYFIFKISKKTVRGEHAHIKCHQFIIAASGSFDILVDDGLNKRTFSLNRPYYGFHIPPGIWAAEMGFSSGAICLVLTSHVYDENDYIRDYHEYIKYVSTEEK